MMTRSNDIAAHPSHEVLVRSQYGPRAAAYVGSTVHAAGPDLDRISAMAAEIRPAHALDLGAGGGHVSYRLAAQAARVTACDLSPEMVAAIAASAEERGIANIEGVVAPAEALPFTDGQFDFLACRFTAHHWRDLDAGLREARRVLAPGARAVFVDVIAPEQVQADGHLQAVELLRDPSHVRDYRVSEWIAALGRANFAVTGATTHRLRMDFPDWIARMRTTPVHVAAIRSLQSIAPDMVAGHFALEADGSFTLDVASFEVV